MPPRPSCRCHLPGFGVEQRTIRGVRGCNLACFRRDIVRINGHNEDFVGFWCQDSEFVLRLMRSGVRRQDAILSAMVFHLEHEKEFVAEDFQRNSTLLEQARSGPIFTPRGLYPVYRHDSEARLTRRAA